MKFLQVKDFVDDDSDDDDISDEKAYANLLINTILEAEEENCSRSELQPWPKHLGGVGPEPSKTTHPLHGHAWMCSSKCALNHKEDRRSEQVWKQPTNVPTFLNFMWNWG